MKPAKSSPGLLPPAAAGDGAGAMSSAAAAATAAAAGAGGSRSMELRPSSEFTMYAHTDLGGVLPASVINKLCKKPAYRVMRKVRMYAVRRRVCARVVHGCNFVLPLGCRVSMTKRREHARVLSRGS